MPSELLIDIKSNLNLNSRTNSWQLLMDHKTDIGKIRLPNSIRETIHLIDPNMRNLQALSFSKQLKLSISTSISAKPND